MTVLDTRPAVIRCLSAWTDWWQPASTSIVSISSKRHARDGSAEPFRAGLLDSIEERAELGWRLRHLEEIDVEILYRFYVLALPATDVARHAGMSTRQCYRRRDRALETLVALAEPMPMNEWVG